MKSRDSLLYSQRKPQADCTTRLITCFSQHHTQIGQILQHCHLLSDDPIVSKYIETKPQVTY